MILNHIDLDKLERLLHKQAEQRLTRYLCQAMPAVLSRLPTTPQCVAAFVTTAGKEAVADGYGDGRLFSTHVTLSFLLGLGWSQDVHQNVLEPILTDTGIPKLTRLDLALNRATAVRKQIEGVLPQTHQGFLTLLAIDPDELSAEHIWRAFEHSAWLHGENTPQRVQQCFEIYEADALRLLELPPVLRRKYSTYDLIVTHHRGGRLPLPSDALCQLPSRQLQHLGHHVLLAQSFGRFFYRNPLFAALHDGLKQDIDLRYTPFFLQNYLQQHQRILMEEATNEH